MKIGITGASGQLGHLVVEQLKVKASTAETDLVALVRSPEKAASLGIEARTFDYDAPETLESSLAGIERLVLISGSEVGQRARQHQNVIDAAKKAGVQWIVYTSILHADTSGISLAEEHLATEAALKESQIPFTLLRNGWYTENYTGSIAGSLAAGAFVGSAGEGKIASAPRSDYAEAAATVVTDEAYKGQVFELAGDTAYTLSELAAEVAKQTGKDFPYKDLPAAEYAGILKGMGLPEALADAIAGWDVSASKGDLFDDTKQLSKLIGHKTGSLADAVNRVLEA